MANQNCQQVIPEYTEPGCDPELGSIVAAALVHESIEFTDISDADEWDAGVYPGDINIYSPARGSYDGGSDNSVTGKGKQAQRIIGRTHSATFRVDGTKENRDHWNAMNASNEHKFAFVVGQDFATLYYVPVNVTVSAKLPVEEDINSERDVEVTIQWSDFDIPEVHDAPSGVFD